MLAPVRTAPPAAPLVSLEEAKAFLRVDHGDDDEVITALIGAATSHLDGWSGILGRALINQTWRQDFGRFHRLRLPLVPVQSVSSVAYFDGANQQQTLSSDTWQVVADAGGAYLGLKPGSSWPSVYGRDDAVQVTFIAGYGPTAADLPEAIRLAAKLHVQMHYDGDGEHLRPAFNALVGPFRRISL